MDSLSRNLFPVFDLNDGGSVFASALSLFPTFNVRIIRPIQFLEPAYATPIGIRLRLHADLPVATSRTGASYGLLPSRCPFFNPRFLSRQRPSGYLFPGKIKPTEIPKNFQVRTRNLQSRCLLSNPEKMPQM